jgi:hypothetical protein
MAAIIEQLVQQARKTYKKKRRKSHNFDTQCIRINGLASVKILDMSRVTGLSKMSLTSYAIFLLNEEFIKWLKCRPDTKFGYEQYRKEVDNEQREVLQIQDDIS